MTSAEYDATIARMSDATAAGLSAELDARKPEVLGLFPIAVAMMLRLCWWSVVKIAPMLADAAVSLVIGEMDKMTIGQVAELFRQYRAKR